MSWVFFDIGDVLFDEDAQHQYLFHSMLLAMRRNGVDVAWDDYRMQIHACARRASATAMYDAVRLYVPDETLWQKIYHEGRGEYQRMREPRPYGMLLDNITAVIQDLHADFRLGIIANQHPPILDALHDYGLQPYFDVIAIDEIVGVSKPDLAIFRWALDRAGCTPQQAIMVGDRPDNDIAPANTLGMGTVRFQRGILYTYYDPLSDSERANMVVKKTMRLAPAVRQLAASRSEE